MPHTRFLVASAFLFACTSEPDPASETCEVAEEITVCVRDRCAWGGIDWTTSCALACASFLEEQNKIDEADPHLVENLGFSLVCWLESADEPEEVEGACDVAESDSPELLECLDAFEG